MRARTLSAFVSPTAMEHLVTLVATVRERRRARKSDDASGFVPSARGTSGVDDRRELAETSVLGVREAKSMLPAILNDAADGAISFVSSGKGGSVLIVGTNALADALATLEDDGAMTVAEAIASLPFEPAQLAPLSAPKGRQPRRGWLDGETA